MRILLEDINALTVGCTVEPLIMDTSKWMAQGLCVWRGRLKIDSKKKTVKVSANKSFTPRSSLRMKLMSSKSF